MLDYHLLVFTTVAEKKNFSRAAEALNLTQPAISLQIQTLEEHYGVRLFERSNKRVELTRAGEILYDYAIQILGLHNEAQQALNDLIGLVTGRLVIGASLTIGEYVLPRLLATYTQMYPKVSVEVFIGNTEEIAEHALSNMIDVGLVEGPVIKKRLLITPFMDDELMLIVPSNHRLSAYSYVELNDLSNEIFILREAGSGTRFVMDELLHELPFEPKKMIQLGSTQSIKEAVEAGLGISFISKWTIRKELSLGTLNALRVKNHELKRQFSILYKENQFQSRAVTEFIQLTTQTKIPDPVDIQHRHEES
ncbi:LysR family transcriptional regulator [Collibacillus ludicampi]|uniref:LysR family transcriptional regulator n=1 Tax=Collibacillus ludicampi TaxID=2771369 RepID=A0AAV4LAI1_9BACL|nr:selenium metabolism-associated LysR family transcriptional regulator [Collibacillus ludicampi]GIM44864.1 LysR family transcriptional regulator [Collibacillus ludicampi]